MCAMREISAEQVAATIRKSQYIRKYIEDVAKLVAMMSAASGLIKGTDKPIEATILGVVIALVAWAYFSLLGVELIAVYLGRTNSYFLERGRVAQVLYVVGSTLLFLAIFQCITEAIKVIAKSFGLG